MSKMDKMFDKAAFGYRTEDVDSYIEEQNYKIAALETENKSLQEKMQILADKINEYRAEESDLKDALVGAQKLGNSIIAEAKAKAEAMLSEAQKKSDLILYEAQKKSDDTVNSIKKEADREKIRLLKMQREVSDFKSRLLSIYKSHLNAITNLPDYEDEETDPPIEEKPEPVQAIAEEKSEPAEQETAPAEPAAETSQTESVPPEEAATVRFGRMSESEEKTRASFEQKYGDLRFGKNNS